MDKKAFKLPMVPDLRVESLSCRQIAIAMFDFVCHHMSGLYVFFLIVIKVWTENRL